MKQKQYTYTDCYNIAKECETPMEMHDRNESAYKAAIRNKWMDSFDWFTRKLHKPYTYEEVYNIARQYTKLLDFQKGSTSAYHKARRNGWLADYSWFIPHK
ncbi:MAG: hypothetical protein K6B45_02500 [Bacteroidaceae bacterium]|nr:hypothetical protein [Bacteroidaceae bacterium]